MPTMTRVWLGDLVYVVMSANQIQWIPVFIQVVSVAIQYHGAAQLVAQRRDLLQRQPVGPDDPLVQLHLRLECQRLGGKARALVGYAVVAAKQIDAGQACNFHGPGGFFQGFAVSRLYETFVCFQMSRRLIEYNTIVADFLNHEKTAVVFNDGRDRNVG